MNIKLPIRISETGTLVNAEDCWLTVEETKDLVRIANLHERLVDALQDLIVAKMSNDHEWRKSLRKAVTLLSEVRQ